MSTLRRVPPAQRGLSTAAVRDHSQVQGEGSEASAGTCGREDSNQKGKVMASAEDLLEEMLEKQLELVRAKKGSEKESALEARIAALEAQLEAKPKTEREEAMEELDDDEWALIEAHRAGKSKKEDPVVVEDEQKPGAKERKTRQGRKSGSLYHYVTDDDGRVKAVDIPTIYSGPDEDDEVELPEDEAAAA